MDFFDTKTKVIMVFAVIGFSLYSNTFDNQMFWDDQDIILNNQFVHDFNFPKFFSENQNAGSGLLSNYWRPMMLTVFSLEWQIWGDWAPGYHFVNTALHIGNAILLFFILSKLLPRADLPAMPARQSGESARYKLLPFLTALVFLIHPLQTEAVTYVSGFADVLSTFFIFVGILTFFRFRDSGDIKFYWWTVGSYIAATLSKDSAVVMPAMLALTDFFY